MHAQERPGSQREQQLISSGRTLEEQTVTQRRVMARRDEQGPLLPGARFLLLWLLLLATVETSLSSAAPTPRLDDDDEVATSRFRSLGTLYLQHRGLSVENGPQFNAPLTLGSPGNISLTYVRRAVDLQPNAEDLAGGSGEAPRLEVACYVGRVHYSLREAYATSQSLHDLADQAVRDLTRRRRAADEAVAQEAQPQRRSKPPELHRSSVLATHQVHHRIRDIVRQKQALAALASSSNTEEEHLVEKQMKDKTLTSEPSDATRLADDDDRAEKEEALALQGLEQESTVRLDRPSDPNRPATTETSPGYVTFGRELCFAAASPVPPFHHVADHNLPGGKASHSHDAGLRGCVNISELLAAHEGASPSHRPATNSEARAYRRLGDLVTAEYKKTNNWKFCRNVQHGVYFNASATIYESSESNSGTGFSYAQFRCLVTRFLVDVCLVVEVMSDSSSDDAAGSARATYAIRRGCSDNYGNVFTYAPLKHGRMDEVAASDSSADLRLPLTIRVCHEYRPADVLRTQGVATGPGLWDGSSGDGSAAPPAEQRPHCVGCSVADVQPDRIAWSYPSYEYTTRLILEEYAKLHGALFGETHVQYDWSHADFAGRRDMNETRGSWTILWVFFGFLTAAMAIIGCLIWYG